MDNPSWTPNIDILCLHIHWDTPSLFPLFYIDYDFSFRDKTIVCMQEKCYIGISHN